LYPELLPEPAAAAAAVHEDPLDVGELMVEETVEMVVVVVA
jgi:hypothetical protein